MGVDLLWNDVDFSWNEQERARKFVFVGSNVDVKLVRLENVMEGLVAERFESTPGLCAPLSSARGGRVGVRG